MADSTRPALGRLVSVPLREVWTHEANDFTPWLADAENLTLLAETLNLTPLQVQGTEVRVGNFFIDILARDVDGRVVVIENQFGPTDHTHLGQIMTYVGGQEGPATVIWIAEAIRPEHRAAVDWLNRSTSEDFAFFAVEVEALRIGTSPPAPWFNVVAKPNAWSRDIVRAARSSGTGELTDRQKAYMAYWAGFGAFLRERGAPYRMPDPAPRDYWCGFGIGRTGFVLQVTAGFRDRRIGVEIYISHAAAKVAFDKLAAERNAIEEEFGGPLDWLRMDDRKGCRIVVTRTDLDPNLDAQRPQQFEWLFDQMERFSRVFRDRIRSLAFDAPEPEPATAALDPAAG
jgi:hypothetical protein